MKVIITGVHGQDGKLLRALLEAGGHEVLGIDRPRGAAARGIAGGRAELDLCDRPAVEAVIAAFQPDQIYHLAACHHSSEQAGNPALDQEMVRTNFLAVEAMLGAILTSRPCCRLLLAGSSQMYSRVDGQITAVDEDTKMAPSTFYGHTKAWARELLGHYRQHYGVFGATAILFNHESPERPPSFLSRKITRAAARAAAGLAADLQVRDASAAVDWSSARDIVEGMRLILAADAPSDYVLASGRARSVVELLDVAFRQVGLNWKSYTRVGNPRRGPVAVLLGNPRRAEEKLGWRRQVGFEQMIGEMIARDRADLARELQRM